MTVKVLVRNKIFSHCNFFKQNLFFDSFVGSVI